VQPQWNSDNARMQPLATPLTDAEIEELDELLAGIQEPFEPMDTSALDGYLCGVLLQPVTISPQAWLPLVFDIEGRPLPTTTAEKASISRITEQVLKRHADLSQAITARQWFDPWIYEGDEDELSAVEAQLPWVAGFAAAMDQFPALLALDNPQMLEPLAVLYAAFDPDDLEDAEQLLPLIEALEPPSTLAEAAEDLVRSVLLLADVSRPRHEAAPRRATRGAAPASRGQAGRRTPQRR
jgi:uncharacterized protein